MDHFGSPWQPSQQGQAPAYDASQNGLSHRMASFSDISDFGYLDPYQSALALQQDDKPDTAPDTAPADPSLLRGRESLVSLSSIYETVETAAGATSAASAPSAFPSPALSSPSSFVQPFGASYFVPKPASSAPSTTPITPALARPASVSWSERYSGLTGSRSNGHDFYDSPGGAYDAPALSASTLASAAAVVAGTQTTSPSTATPSSTYRPLSRMFSRRSPRSRGLSASHATIYEEDMNGGSGGPNHHDGFHMASLVQNAAPISGSVADSPPSRRRAGLRSSFPSLRSQPYAPLARNDTENDDVRMSANMASGPSIDMPVDISLFTGPSTDHDIAFIKRLQETEASGHLSGGLGVGFKPTATLTESELLGAVAVANNSEPGYGPRPASGIPGRASTLRRTLTRRWASPSQAMPRAVPVSPITPSTAATAFPPAFSPSSFASPASITRRNTLRALAQNEANRRGEIVAVIMEEDEDEEGSGAGEGEGRKQGQAGGIGDLDRGLTSEVDLSVVSGPSGPDPLSEDAAQRRRRQKTVESSKTQVFYPQPNWRPFSMRWPYLVSLILVSVVLGVAQELVLQVSRKRSYLVKFRLPREISPGIYFAMKFAPTLITVTYGVLWQITDFEVKRLEAFYQMSKEQGALAGESINVDYVTFFAFFRPFRALHCRHYAVAVSAVASLLAVSLVPTLGAATIVLKPDRATRESNPQELKFVSISEVWSRTLTATFFVIAALGCILFWLLQSRRSGLLSDVKGIAGLASMAVVSHIMTDFKRMDVATHQDIHDKLRNRRYVLRNSSLAPDDENPTSPSEGARNGGSSDGNGRLRVPGSGQRRPHGLMAPAKENPHPLMLRAGGCLPYVAGIAAFTALLPTVLFTPANVVADQAPWVLTACAVGIKMGWGGLETSVRMMEPYYLLWRRHAPAKTLTLDYTAMPFLWVALQALTNRHLLVFFVTFGTVMTELLTVLVTSLATVEGRAFIGDRAGSRTGAGDIDVGDRDSGEETAASFWLSLGLAMFILVYMGVVATVAFWRRRRPFMPRLPNTIASVLAYIHQSKMLWNFVGMSKLCNAEMLRALEDQEMTYGLGWFVGRDGQTHCGVDYEELISNYKPGYDYSRSNNPWMDQSVDWL